MRESFPLTHRSGAALLPREGKVASRSDDGRGGLQNPSDSARSSRPLSPLRGQFPLTGKQGALSLIVSAFAIAAASIRTAWNARKEAA
jgi:hypothetical protein